MSKEYIYTLLIILQRKAYKGLSANPNKNTLIPNSGLKNIAHKTAKMVTYFTRAFYHTLNEVSINYPHPLLATDTIVFYS